MPTYQQLARKLKNSVLKTQAEDEGVRQGIIGRYDASGNLDKNSELDTGYVWFTVKDNNREAYPALCKIKAQLGAPVLARRNKLTRGLEIFDIDPQAALDEYGEAASTLLVPDRAGELVREVVPGRNLLPGRLRLADAGGVWIHLEPFHYLTSTGTVYFPGGDLDLTAYEPPTPNTWYWVKVGVDPATNAPVAVAGTAQSVLLPLEESQLAAISSGNYVPCAGVKLRNAQTTIALESDIADCRLWLTGLGSGAGGIVTQPNTISGTETIVAGRNAVLAGDITVTGSLTVDGTMAIVG